MRLDPAGIGSQEVDETSLTPQPLPSPFPPPSQSLSSADDQLGPRRSTRRAPWLSLAGLAAGLAGIAGALLPAFDGQRIGDPASAAYRIGVPVGVAGALIALGLGIAGIIRSTRAPVLRSLAVVATTCGGLALLLTAALVFSG